MEEEASVFSQEELFFISEEASVSSQEEFLQKRLFFFTLRAGFVLSRKRLLPVYVSIEFYVCVYICTNENT